MELNQNSYDIIIKKYASSDHNFKINSVDFRPPKANNYTQILLTTPQREEQSKFTKFFYRKTPDVIAHATFGSRVNKDGNKVLLIVDMFQEPNTPDNPNEPWEIVVFKEIVKYATQNNFDLINIIPRLTWAKIDRTKKWGEYENKKLFESKYFFTLIPDFGPALYKNLDWGDYEPQIVEVENKVTDNDWPPLKCDVDWPTLKCDAYPITDKMRELYMKTDQAPKIEPGISKKLFEGSWFENIKDWTYEPPDRIYVYAENAEEAVKKINAFGSEQGINLTPGGGMVMTQSTGLWLSLDLKDLPEYYCEFELRDVTASVNQGISNDLDLIEHESIDVQNIMRQIIIEEFRRYNIIDGDKELFMEDIAKVLSPQCDDQTNMDDQEEFSAPRR